MLFSYTAIHPTTGNTGNQKPQPPKHHHHTTTTTTKIKITQKSKSHRERDRWVEGDRAEARSKGRSSGAVRSTRCDMVRAIVGLELARSSGSVRSALCYDQRDRCDWCLRSSDWSSGFADNCRTGLELGVRPLLSLSISLSLSPEII